MYNLLTYTDYQVPGREIEQLISKVDIKGDNLDCDVPFSNIVLRVDRKRRVWLMPGAWGAKNEPPRQCGVDASYS